ncbi:related to MAF1 Protein required for sorting of Mod5p [Cephalotrichum gorgonifer]|uniref:AP-1 complex subunit sigma-1 n=1 Tax=Cephalotrichum gorgonifer TaxID=2041049 RepID=A0AAE8SRK1_9PEZI|nr:related to MAF1 Protein required for sorting of Mod5p [Cephalotrichum gorgonifer]
MAIQYLILLSRQGKVRLAKWFTTLSPKEKGKIVKDVSQLVLARRTRMCNFLEYKDTKIVYRRYASLFFIAGCDADDNELITLEIIHRYVEQMDKYYGNVCELDIIFSFTKAYYILDEILLAGELQESSKKNILRCISQQDSLEDMEYLPVPAFDTVTSALNFNTPDCNVTGGCDLYTTKSTGSDKKLYKNINDDLDSQHAELLKLGASLSPPQKAAMMATSPSLFSQSSAFGPLSELSSRRTFAYLIATLNASHPHYDFSNVLAPGDFKRERSLRRLMANLDSILQNVRGSGDPGMADGPAGTTASTSWSQHCWSLIDKEMHLDECTMFNYRPDVDPFEDDESAIWSVHYFFFNRALKRVAYLYLRVVPVISTQSPTMVATALSGGRAAIGLGATKRARYWLSEHDAAIAETYDDEDEDDGFLWNRGEDGDLVQFSEDDYTGGDDFDASDDEMDLDQDRGPVRGVSEDIASRMEI